MDRTKLKMEAGYAAADTLVKSGMKLGLGTGSTAIHAVRRVGEGIAAGKLRGVRAVSTSFQTTMECEALGIPLFSLNSREIGGSLDLTIDGADEIDGEGRLIKGGGAALLLEKIVAYSSASYAVVADSTKRVKELGRAFLLPVEIIPEARVSVIRALSCLGAEAVLREGVKKAGPVVTDGGHFVLDLSFRPDLDINPMLLEREINLIPGVVENGFFTGLGAAWEKPRLFIAGEGGTL